MGGGERGGGGGEEGQGWLRVRGGEREREGGKKHRDLIAVELSAKASGREQCSPRRSKGGAGGGGGGCHVYILGVFLKHNWPSLSFDL